MKKRLPPGVSEAQFQSAMHRMADAVGSDWVFTADDDIHTYRDGYTPFRGDEGAEYVPSGAVAPSEVEQVQKIVTIANDARIPLWPFSTGRNLGYGGSAPRLNGTLMVDLKRMNRVLNVDEHRATALVEPGVSYMDFYKHLREKKLKVWLDCADPGWGSLIGNALDHGVGHSPYRDHNAAICGLEVVLPNGELLRTGAGALPGARNWQNFHYGFGPHIAPLFGQGNFGIVTKAGFWLLPEPEAGRSDVISVTNHDDVHPFLDVMATLVAERTIDSSWNVSSPLLSSRDSKVLAATARSNGEPSAELDALGREQKLAYWSARIYQFGALGVMDAKWEYIQRRLRAAVPSVQFRNGNLHHFPADYDTIEEGADGDMFARESMNIPSLSIFTGPGASRNRGHVFFSPIIGMSGEEMVRARRVFQKAYKDLDLGIPGAISGWSWFRASFVVLFGQAITDDADQNRKMREKIKQLVKISADAGWGEYRTPPVFMDDVMSSYDFNNNALRRFSESIKDALDPNGIIAPGRSGIWPKHLRGRKIP
jgi:4-cresol dehydrogenase (hydroxylating)